MRAYAIFEVTILGLIHAAAADGFKLKNKRNLEKCDHRWQSLGDDIEGESCDGSGWVVSLSNDGNRVAIGAKVDEKGKGSVRVYKWDNCEWKQLGKTIIEKYDNDPYTDAVSISGDGNTVAVGVSGANNNKGSVIVYYYSKKKKWVKCGVIYGEKNRDFIGSNNKVSISDNGKTLAIGGDAVDVIKVVAVKVDKNEKGCSLKEKAELNVSKNRWIHRGSVSLSGNGKMLAVGTSSGAGLVEFFRLSGKKWDKCDYTFDGLTMLTGFGKAVSLSVDGARVVIGGDDSTNKGIVALLEAVGNLKKCEYEIIDFFHGENEEDYSGGSVSISGDGQSIAIGAIINDDGGENAGRVRIHTQDGGTWYSEDIDGLDFSRLGTSVSMSGNGKTVAIGAPGMYYSLGYGYDEENIGHVKVMKFGDCEDEDELKIHRDPVKCMTEAPTRSRTGSPTTEKSKKTHRLESFKTPKIQRSV